MHGSMSWEAPTKVAKPSMRMNRGEATANAPRNLAVIPPVWNKGVTEDEDVYWSIWEAAAAALRGAEVIAVVGFSMGTTDLYAQSLFRVAVSSAPKQEDFKFIDGRPKLGIAETHLKSLVLVTPDKEARSRIRDVFAAPLRKPGTVVRQYSRFEDFIAALPRALHV
jgi:hypothetical protein